MDKDPFLRSVYLFEYSPDVLYKKTEVLDIFNTDKKCFMEINIESSPPTIWIRIRFLEINGSPSLYINIKYRGIDCTGHIYRVSQKKVR